MKMKVYQAIASAISALPREWAEERLALIEREYLPSGSGIDAGCKILVEESHKDRIVIQTEFHHMNEVGYYDGWTHHKIIVTPSLIYGFDLRITGRDRNGIKEYLGQLFDHALSQEFDADRWAQASMKK